MSSALKLLKKRQNEARMHDLNQDIAQGDSGEEELQNAVKRVKKDKEELGESDESQSDQG